MEGLYNADAAKTLAGAPCYCPDGPPSLQLRVLKDGSNKGRYFFACAKPRSDPQRCNYFAWDGESARPASSTVLQCNCGKKPVEMTVSKAGPNHGRTFYVCSQSRTGSDSCNFFQWDDVMTPVCLCNVRAQHFSVRKAGPNQGRGFFSCGNENGKQCAFFKWTSEDSGTDIGVQAAPPH